MDVEGTNDESSGGIMTDEKRLIISINAIDTGDCWFPAGVGAPLIYTLANFSIRLNQEERAQLDSLRGKIAERYRPLMKDNL